ncbi:MAG: hypothetical protein ACQESE_00365 [Nanobdellota archaeon]
MISKVAKKNLFSLLILVMTLFTLTCSVLAVNETTLTNTTINTTDTESSVTEEEAAETLQDARNHITQMEQAGLSTTLVEDLYLQAEKEFDGQNITKLYKRAQNLQDADPQAALELMETLSKAKLEGTKVGANFSKAVERAEEIEARKEQAFEIMDRLALLEIEIEELQDNSTDIKNLTGIKESYSAAKEAFSYERYDEAQTYMEETSTAIGEALVQSSRLKAMAKASQRSVEHYLKTYYIEISIGVVVLAILFIISRNEFLIFRKKKKLSDLDFEYSTISDLYKKAQSDYFHKKLLSQSTYKMKQERYKDRMAMLKKQLQLVHDEINSLRSRRKAYLIGIVYKQSVRPLSKQELGLIVV